MPRKHAQRLTRQPSLKGYKTWSKREDDKREMAVCSSSSLSVFSPNSLPKTSYNSEPSVINVKPSKASYNIRPCANSCSRRGFRKLNAGGELHFIEPDLNEDPVDRWATPGISPVCTLLNAHCMHKLCCRLVSFKNEKLHKYMF